MWSLTFREEHGLSMFEKGLQKKIFRPKGNEVPEDLRLHNEELHDLTCEIFMGDQIKL
jgi:hypothetical protein